MRTASRPEEILEVYRRAPHVHPYGIADVEQLWGSSRWWRRGPAVVGLLLLEGTHVVYAIADDPPAQAATLELLVDLAGALPDRFTITGPTGLAEALSRVGYAAAWSDAYDKLHLPADAPLPPQPEGVVRLARADLPDVEEVFATDPDAGDFFHPGLLDTGHYLGRRVGGRLVAVAGVHVVDPVNGVAAIGNVATDPRHRRQGHGRAVVSALLHDLRPRVDVVGLNVRHRTAPARAMYAALGFVHAVTYEEAHLHRAGRPGTRAGTTVARRPL